MAHDVNQSEMEYAAQVRSALVDKISSERMDLWIPEDTEWEWLGHALTLRFSSDFTCQLAKKMLLTDMSRTLRKVTQSDAEVLFETRLHATACKPASQPETAPSSMQLLRERRRTKTSKERLPIEATTVASSSPNQEQVNSSYKTGAMQAGQTSSVAIDEVLSPVADAARADDVARIHEATGTSPADQVSALASSVSMVPSQLSRPRDICEMFITGDCNALAWTTASMIIGEPGRLSPVLLYGPSGCGKSMLVGGVVQQLRTRRRMMRVVHMTSEQFTNDFTEGLRAGGLPMFRRKYRDVEALVLDDIQFFAGKRSTIAELKHTLDNLVRLGKQVLLTADRGLNDLEFLGNELVGRLRGGLVTPLSPLDETVRTRMLTRKIEEAKLPISSEIVSQLAARACGDGRVISGMVNRLIAIGAMRDSGGSRSNGGVLDWETCWSAVCDLVQATQPVVRLGDIERVVCSMFGLDAQSLQTTSKHRSVTQPRMLAMFLARKYTPAAYQEIGHYFGRRKHSTVISAEKTVNSWLTENPNLKLARGMSVRDAIRQVEAQLHVG